MQKSESVVNTSISIGCNVIRRYNNWYKKTSISLLFVASFSAYYFYKVNKYNTLSAKRNSHKKIRITAVCSN